LTSAIWPARLQHINSGVLFSKLYNANKESELWLDGAHNISGAEMLIASIQQMTKKLPLYLINGRSKDRDIEGFLKYFMNKVEFLCATHIKSEPLSENSENIYNIAHRMGFYADLSDSVSEAIDKCLKHASGKSIRILICGSLYLLGDVLAANQEQ
jgi:dihydrofolate synthase/folylpolyglutamate synthase